MSRFGAFTPVCSARLYIGAGIPGRPGEFVPRDEMQRVINREIGKRFPGMTRFRARGVWKGTGEPTFVVEVISPGEACGRHFARAQAAAGEIARKLRQEAVMVVARDSSGRGSVDFVSAARKTRTATTARRKTA